MVNKNRWVSVQVFYVNLVSILGIIGLLTGCAQKKPALRDRPTKEPDFPKSFKGYELYIWEYEDETWFTLISGTNRKKGFDEIVSSDQAWTSDGWVKVTVQGLDQAVNMLDRLSPDENLILLDLPAPDNVGDAARYSPPSEDIFTEIESYCLEKGLQLSH